MTTNAQWWVDYQTPTGTIGMLSLMSADLADPKRARRRAADTAKARLAKKLGVKVTVNRVRCVG